MKAHLLIKALLEERPLVKILSNGEKQILRWEKGYCHTYGWGSAGYYGGKVIMDILENPKDWKIYKE